MADPIPGVEVSSYFMESIVPLSTVEDESALAAIGMYLLDLMAVQGYRVVSGVRAELPEPVSAAYPTGWTALRMIVDVQEFDVDVDPAEA